MMGWTKLYASDVNCSVLLLLLIGGNYDVDNSVIIEVIYWVWAAATRPDFSSLDVPWVPVHSGI